MAKGFKTGGRQKGTPNKRTLEVEQFARSILEDEAYQANLKMRALEGSLAPALEVLLFHYVFGKPIEKIEHSGNAQKPLQVIVHRAH